MPYTRRSLLRDSAVLSLGSTLVPRFLRAQPAGTFSSGIRIFFAGAWLFAPEPDTAKTGYMRAVTLDPAAQSGGKWPHAFPYGVWDPNLTDWDLSIGKSLPETLPSGGDVTPHNVAVAGYTPAATATVDLLFKAANDISQFPYFPKTANNPFQVNWNNGHLRTVSLPIPTRIIPAAFRPDAFIIDPSQVMYPNPGTTTDVGIATSYIFEYPGASSMTLALAGQAPGAPVPASTDYPGDFHFHTVPTNMTAYDDEHDKYVLAALLAIAGITSISIHEPKLPLAPIQRGVNVPAGVDFHELEMLYADGHIAQMQKAAKNAKEGYRPFLAMLATCCAGGGGVGGGV